MHIDDDVMHRLLDSELGPSEARSVHDHLAECEACQSRIELARHENAAAHELLETLDHPVPPLTATRAIAVSRTGRSSMLRRAATILLLLAAGAGGAYALPGSPVRTWIEERLGTAPVAESTTTAIDASSPEPESTGGLAVEPGASLLVLIEDPPAGGTIEAGLYDGALVEATAHGGTVSFASDEGRIAIRGGDAGTRFLVRIPRNARRVEIRVEGRTVFLKTAAAISASGDARSGDAWTIPVDAPPLGTGR